MWEKSNLLRFTARRSSVGNFGQQTRENLQAAKNDTKLLQNQSNWYLNCDIPFTHERYIY